MGKVLLLTALLITEPTFTEFVPPEKIEMRRKRGKKHKGRKRGGSGLR